MQLSILLSETKIKEFIEVANWKFNDLMQIMGANHTELVHNYGILKVILTKF